MITKLEMMTKIIGLLLGVSPLTIILILQNRFKNLLCEISMWDQIIQFMTKINRHVTCFVSYN